MERAGIKSVSTYYLNLFLKVAKRSTLGRCPNLILVATTYKCNMPYAGYICKTVQVAKEMVAVKIFPLQDKQSWFAEQEIYNLAQVGLEMVLPKLMMVLAFSLISGW